MEIMTRLAFRTLSKSIFTSCLLREQYQRYILCHLYACEQAIEVLHTQFSLWKDLGDKIPLDFATAERASDEIKALLQPRTIKNEPENVNDDASNLVPADDYDNGNTATEIQDQPQAANREMQI